MSLIPDRLPTPERRPVVTTRPTKEEKRELPPPSSPEPARPDAETPERGEVEVVREDVEAHVAVQPIETTVEIPAVTSVPGPIAGDSTDDVMIIEATTQSEMEQRMTLRQLRDICSGMNLVTTGKKAELVARIIEARERSNGE